MKAMKEENFIENEENELSMFENVREDKGSDVYCFISFFDTATYHKITIDPHYHDYIELIYVLSGDLSVTVNKKIYSASSGDLLIVIPGEVHSFTRKKGCKYVCIQADPAFIFAAILSNTDLRYVLPFVLSCYPDARLFKSSEIDSTDLPKLIHEVVNECMDKKNFYKLSVRANLSLIALWIFRRWDELRVNLKTASEKVNNSSINRIAPVLEKIDRDFKDNLTAENMAEVLDMSYSYFSRFFKATVGKTFSEYVSFVRINEAEHLLLTTDLSVAEIAAEVGFSNPSYFISQFRKQLHVTPKKFKMRYSTGK